MPACLGTSCPQTDAEVFRFGAWDGGGSKADWLLPAPGFLEELTDLPTASGLLGTKLRVAPALVKATSEVQSAAQFLCSLDGSLPTTAKIIDSRCEDLFRRREGSVYAQELFAMAKFTSVQSLKEQFWKGASLGRRTIRKPRIPLPIKGMADSPPAPCLLRVGPQSGAPRSCLPSPPSSTRNPDCGNRPPGGMHERALRDGDRRRPLHRLRFLHDGLCCRK